MDGLTDISFLKRIPRHRSHLKYQYQYSGTQLLKHGRNYASKKLYMVEKYWISMRDWVWYMRGNIFCSKGSWLCAMYLIPGCVRREVSLGSESLSGAGRSGAAAS